MGVFGNLFSFTKKLPRSVALLDVCAESVGGAYVLFIEGQVPQIVYATRIAIEAHDGEALETAMERTLAQLGEQLIREGAPVLLRVGGSGRADVVLASVSSPWQSVTVRTEHIEDNKKAFTFTRALVEKTLANAAKPPAGSVLADEMAMGTILNGYETHEPYGKRVNRASIIVLSAFVTERAGRAIAGVLRTLFHTKDIILSAGAALHAQALRDAFPHERDALMLDATGTDLVISLVRHGFLVATLEVHTPTEEAWTDELFAALHVLAKRYPLPHAIFLISSETVREKLMAALAAAPLGALWLSDEPPTVMAVQPAHLAGLLKYANEGAPDLHLMLLALYARHSLEK